MKKEKYTKKMENGFLLKRVPECFMRMKSTAEQSPADF